MALEKRDGNLYYYRSVRSGDEVRKVYVGSGEIARLAHEWDVMSRTEEKAERGRAQDEVERMEALGAPVRELPRCARSRTYSQGHTWRRPATGESRVNGG